MKFRYYLYYKDYHYYLYDRKRKIIENTEITFKSMYDYIKYKHYLFIDIHFKNLSLYEFFRDFASFEEEERTKI